MVKKRLKVPFVYNLQDIFPDSMVSTGLMHEGSLLWRIGRKIENYTYNNADKIIVIGEDFKKNLINKGVPEEKIEVIYNWVDDEAIEPVKRSDNSLFDELNLPRDQFYVTYAGNLGESQGIDVILDAAELLRDEANIHFVLFGGGALYEVYRNKVDKLKLSNLFLFPLQPQSKVSQVYSLGDVSIVSCKKGVGKGALPSKTWSIMAAGTPVLASFDTGTELERILHDNACGVLVEAGNAAALVEKILWFYRSEKERKKMGLQARLIIKKEFSLSTNVSKYIQLFESLCGLN